MFVCLSIKVSNKLHHSPLITCCSGSRDKNTSYWKQMAMLTLCGRVKKMMIHTYIGRRLNMRGIPVNTSSLLNDTIIDGLSWVVLLVPSNILQLHKEVSTRIKCINNVIVIWRVFNTFHVCQEKWWISYNIQPILYTYLCFTNIHFTKPA